MTIPPLFVEYTLRYNKMKWKQEEVMRVIELDGLTKDYGDVLANDDVSFTVETGEIFGYLGPNGAGKTTIRTL